MDNVFKNYLYPIKCVVTRIDDPGQLNRIQVYIPSLHGEMNDEAKGVREDPGTYPWAQLCSTLFKDSNNSTVSSLQELFAGSVPVILPAVGTVGWVLFEGGDVRTPIYMGSLSSGENNEFVSSVYRGSDNNNLSVGITGSSQLDIIKQVIFEQESGGYNYDVVLKKDGKACSIGLLQWNANRARNLLISIRDADPIGFASICTQYGATFQNALSGNWTSYTITNDNDYNAIKALLNSEVGRKCQDDLVYQDIGGYLNDAIACGVTDFNAQIFFCDMDNQRPADARAVANATQDKSLDGLYKEVMNGGYVSGNPNDNARGPRRTKVYNAIKLLESNGGLNPTSSTNLPSTQTLSDILRYPTDCKTVIEPFSSNHKYITIAPSNNSADFLFADVIAPISGTAYYSKKNESKEDGTYVEIVSGKYIVRLGNLIDHTEGYGYTKEVMVGEKIGRVGFEPSGVPCLYLKLRANGVLTDPLPYLGENVSENINATNNGVIETAVNWMLDTANDPSHGYSQGTRWGPDYDCASFVITGYQNAGVPVKSAGATYTGDMRKAFVACGFVALPYKNGMELIRGDVLLNEVHHTACYIGNNQIVHASKSETGGRYGNPGDQTGTEIYVRDFYIHKYGWNYVLRYTGS